MSNKSLAVYRAGHYVIMSLGKTVNADFLTGSLCGIEESAGVCFTTAFTGEKQKTSGYGTGGISESGSG